MSSSKVRLRRVEEEVQSLKEEVQSLKGEMKKVKEENKELKTEVERLRDVVKYLETNLKQIILWLLPVFTKSKKRFKKLLDNLTSGGSHHV